MGDMIKGKAWKFGDNVDGDSDFFPFKYFMQQQSGVPTSELAEHVLENLNPDFGKKAQKGDFIVAGKNFGCGKAHSGYKELIFLGIGGVIADSVAGGFIKGCVNEAIPVLVSDGIMGKISQDDKLEVDFKAAIIKNLTTNETIQAEPAIKPNHPLYDIFEAGGYVAYLKKKVEESKKKGG